MQTETETSSAARSTPAGGHSSSGASFAGVLSSLAAPQNREIPWNDDDLADDVANISYERALRAHTRVHPANSHPGGHRASETSATAPDHTPEPVPLRTSSITIRLSEAECARVRDRAKEAGLPVSSY